MSHFILVHEVDASPRLGVDMKHQGKEKEGVGGRGEGTGRGLAS